MNNRAALHGDEGAEQGKTAANPADAEGKSPDSAGADSDGMPARAAAGSDVTSDAGDQKGAATQLKLRRLKIHKWRNVLPGTELHFGDGIHALLGKNGTGKTTLLKLISMCVRGNFEEIRSEDFSLEFELESSRYRVSMSVTNESSERGQANDLLASLTGGARASVSAAEPDYWFRIVFSGVSGVPVDIEGTRTEITLNGIHEPLLKPGRVSPFLPYSFLHASNLAIFIAVENGLLVSDAPQTEANNRLKGSDLISYLDFNELLSATSPFRFDEANGLLQALEGSADERHTANPSLSVTLAPSSPQQTTAREWIPPELEGFLGHLEMGQPFPLTQITATNLDLPVLQEYVTLAGFEKIILSLSLQKKIKVGKDTDGYVFGKCKFLLQLRNGDIISHEQLSFGQRRLLAFLYYAACNPDVLIADELTNGLHHEWIEACVDKLSTRQSFVATQNPLLIDYLPVSSAKDAETAFIQCRLVDQDEKQWMSWRNTTPEEAERFWKTYETGVQFINEILRTDGLW